jgi:hypothetical protein
MPRRLQSQERRPGRCRVIFGLRVSSSGLYPSPVEPHLGFALDRPREALSRADLGNGGRREKLTRRENGAFRPARYGIASTHDTDIVNVAIFRTVPRPKFYKRYLKPGFFDHLAESLCR